MVIAAIQPGTFSPSMVSMCVCGSTFSTLPRNACSFLVFATFSPWAFGFDCFPEATEDFGDEPADCRASSSETLRNELLFAGGRPARHAKPTIAEEIRKAVVRRLVASVTLLIGSGVPV